MAYLCAILVFLGLSVIRPLNSTDRQTSDRQTSDRQTDIQTDVRQTDRRQTSDAHHRLMPPPYGGWDITIFKSQRESKMKLTELERVRTL